MYPCTWIPGCVGFLLSVFLDISRYSYTCMYECIYVCMVFSSTFSLSFCFVLFSPVRERVLDFLEEVRMREEGGSRGEKGELWPEEN